MPIIRPLIPLMFGTILGHKINLPDIEFILIIITISVVVLFILSKVYNYTTRGILAAFVWLGIGALHADLRKPEAFTFFRENAEIIVSIDEQINPNDKQIKVRAKLWQINDTAVGNKDWYILLNIRKDSLTKIPDYGDMLFLKATINETKNRGNPYEFDYKDYLQKKRIVAQSFVSDNHFFVINDFKGSILQKWAYQARTFLLQQYTSQSIEGQNLAVLSALTLGYKEELNRETKQQFSGTGAMHILAVSGLHVGIVYMIVLKILQVLLGKKLPFLKFIVVMITLWTFAILSGSSPSVLRAALMFSFVALANTFQRDTNIYNTIFLSAFFLILFKPGIIYEVGFQLSYMAVISIVWLVPVIENWWTPRNTLIKKIWTLLAVSIAAQLGTTPIALFYFHQFPNYFFITNLAVVPLAGIILSVAILFLSVSFIPILSGIIGFILNFMVSLLRFIVEFIDALPYSTTQFIPFDFSQIFLAYALIVSIFMFIQHKYYYLLKLSLIFALIFSVSALVQKTQSLFQNKLVIYNSAPNSVYQIVSGTKSEYYSIITDSSAIFYTNQMLQNFAMHARAEMITKPILFESSEKNPLQIFKLGNNKILFLKNDFFDKKEAKTRLEIDYIVLNNASEISIEKLNKIFKFKSLIIDSSVSNYKRNNWTKEALQHQVPIHDVKTQGAFILQF